MTNANAGMIKHIETLKSALEGKRIYVWDTARKAVWVFSTLALRGIDVAGFVTNFEEFVGESIMGRPIISLEEFSQIENAVAIVDDDVRSGAFSVIASAGEALYRKEALELNPALQNASLYVFGIDDNTWRIAKRLAREGVEIRGFITDGQSNGETILGLPVTGLSEGNLTSDDAILVPADVDRYLDAELASIIESGFGGTVFIHEVTCRWEIWSHSLVPGIDRRLSNGRGCCCAARTITVDNCSIGCSPCMGLKSPVRFSAAKETIPKTTSGRSPTRIPSSAPWFSGHLPSRRCLSLWMRRAI